MIAADSGYLYSLVDVDDAWHVRSVQCHQRLDGEGLISTWPVIAEVCHLLLRRLGQGYAERLLDGVADGGISLWNPGAQNLSRLPALMRKYAAQPMDLADASLVLLAEHLDHGRILSTDLRDFGTYRWKSRRPFTNVLQETSS